MKGPKKTGVNNPAVCDFSGCLRRGDVKDKKKKKGSGG